MTAKKPTFKPLMGRLEKSVRTELLAALREYAHLFRERAQMEVHRAEAVEEMARKVKAGGPPEQPYAVTTREFERAMQLLDIRFNALRERCSRLMTEYGENQRYKLRPTKKSA